MLCFLFSFVFNHTSPTEIYTLSLHDALPISVAVQTRPAIRRRPFRNVRLCCRQLSTPRPAEEIPLRDARSEEHTSELQSLRHLVCRLLLEKKNTSNQLTNY